MQQTPVTQLSKIPHQKHAAPSETHAREAAETLLPDSQGGNRKSNETARNPAAQDANIDARINAAQGTIYPGNRVAVYLRPGHGPKLFSLSYLSKRAISYPDAKTMGRGILISPPDCV